MQDFELGGKQDGSRLIVACMATRGVWGAYPPPQPGKNLNLDPLRLLLTQSGTNFPNNTY